MSKRIQVTLKCPNCRKENYITTRNGQLHPEGMEISKFCNNCNGRTLHKETKRKK